MKLSRMIGVVLCALAVPGCVSLASYRVDAHIPSNPDTVVWGYLPAGRPPVLTVRSGQTVSIDTVSHQGLINGTDPVQFFSAAGIPASEVLPDAIEIYSKAPRPKDAGAHVLTGPVFVEGAEPGDMLEVRMLDFQFRVPYGVNRRNKGTGVLPEGPAEALSKTIKIKPPPVAAV